MRLRNDIVRAVEEEAAMNAGSWSTILKADNIDRRRRLLTPATSKPFNNSAASTRVEWMRRRFNLSMRCRNPSV